MRKNAVLPKNIGKKVQRARNEQRLTQADLAYKVGISETYMGYIEQGRAAPSLDVLQKIAKVLKLDIKELF